MRRSLRARGVTLTEFTDSNPTRHGLLLPEVLDAVGRHVSDAADYRPESRGLLAAREVLAGFYGGSPDDYWLTSSTAQAYTWLLTALADPGDVVACPVPGYPLVEPLARAASVRLRDYRLDYVHPHGWLTDFDSLGGLLRPDSVSGRPPARAVVVVNPGNPTGSYLGSNEYNVMLKLCAETGVPLIADEVFQPFVLDGVLGSGIAAAGRSFGGADQVLTCTLGGLSKLLCAPQLKLGWIRVSGPRTEVAALAAVLDAIADLYLPVSGPIAAALPDLLALAGRAVAHTRTRLTGNLRTLRALTADGPYRVRRTEGGWSALVDVPSYLPATELVLRLLADAHLSVHPGWFYDLADEGALALSLLPRPDVFADHLGGLLAALARIGASA